MSPNPPPNPEPSVGREAVPGHFPDPDDDRCGGCKDVWPCRELLLGHLLIVQIGHDDLLASNARLREALRIAATTASLGPQADVISEIRRVVNAALAREEGE